MADYIVKDTELTNVANAIRTAGGTNSLLSFPNGFVSAVNNISGGSSDFSTATVTFTSTSGTYTIDMSVISSEDDALYDVPDMGVVQSDGPRTVLVPLYKGEHRIYMDCLKDVSSEPVVTGGVTVDFDAYVILITGDGTFTAAGQ